MYHQYVWYIAVGGYLSLSVLTAGLCGHRNVALMSDCLIKAVQGVLRGRRGGGCDDVMLHWGNTDAKQGPGAYILFLLLLGVRLLTLVHNFIHTLPTFAFVGSNSAGPQPLLANGTAALSLAVAGVPINVVAAEGFLAHVTLTLSVAALIRGRLDPSGLYFRFHSYQFKFD